MRIDRDSIGALALVYAIGAIVVFVALYWIRTPWLAWPLTALAAWSCFWQTAFFRVPERKRGGTSRSITSVADGKVVIVERVREPEFLDAECIQISVYMNFFDVHANFWPSDGEVTYYKYYPGKHLLAFAPKASEENEHTSVGLRLPGGDRILFKQLAGGFARRIVCYAREGMPVVAGAQCGIIKFGSRIDMYVPLGADVKVKVGDTVRACETVLAEL